MNSSAKTTAISFLAVAALGAAAIVGCTVDSSVVDDTDGGTQNNNDDDGGTGASDDGGATDTDTGTPATCDSKQQGVFVSAECQSCVAANCCTQLKTCYDLPGDDDAGTVDCNAYDSCIDDCGSKGTDDEVQACYGDCDVTAAPGVKDAYDAIITCASSSCATPCGVGDTPDGG